MPPARSIERLQRLLAVVPYVVRHPGTPVEELTRLFGIGEEELTADLELITMTGLPPYGPGDLIDMEIDEGRVWISMAEHFERPVRLTRAEAIALYLRGAELLGASVEEGAALRSALAKLEEGLGPEALGALRAEVGDGGRAGPLSTIRRAVAARERVEIEYYAAAHDEMTTRRIDPEQVFGAIGNWYVAAWDHAADDERLFRVDRIRGVRPTGETFTPRGLPGRGRPLYSPTEEDMTVRLRLGPTARWVAEYYEVASADERDGLLEIELPTKDLAWVAKLVLRLGPTVEIVSPPELSDLAAALAEETLAAYR